MRVLMPNGALVTIETAIPAIEMRMSFNGREIRLCERATEIGYANGISFFTRVHDNCGMTTGNDVFIGNLRNESVREILASLARQGYVDLSDLKLQNTQPLASSYVFDNGASGAYLLQGFEATCFTGYPFGGFPVASEVNDAVSEAEGTEDDEEDGDE